MPVPIAIGIVGVALDGGGQVTARQVAHRTEVGDTVVVGAVVVEGPVVDDGVAVPV